MHLLIVIDEETQPELVLQTAVAVAAMISCTATILMVVGHESEQQAAAGKLEKAAAVVETAVSNPHRKTRIGQPAAEIASEAASAAYDLVLLGQYPEHGLLAWFTESVTQQVITQVSQPLIIVKEKPAHRFRLLLCDSGLQQVSLLDRLASDLPQLLAHTEKATVLHVMSQISATPGLNGHDLRATAEELIADQTHEGTLLQRDIDKLSHLGVQAQPLVRHGLVVDEILDEAAKDQYDMVVIGAHEQERWPRFLLDNIAEQIVQHINRNVLII